MTEHKNRGGRPSGPAWAHKRTAGVRKAAQRNRLDILADRDPLAELVRLGFEAAEEGDRIKALSSACAYLYPRLSMSVVADATPKQAGRITSEMLVRELSDRIARLPVIEHEPSASEAETEGSDLGGDE